MDYPDDRPLPHSHRAHHAALREGQQVTAHWLHGDADNPVLRSTAAEVLTVTDNHVQVRFTEDVPAAGELPAMAANTACWSIPHECFHPHPRVEPKGG